MGFKVVNTSFGGGMTFSFYIPQPHNHTLHKGIGTMSLCKVVIRTLIYIFFIIMMYNISAEFDLDGCFNGQIIVLTNTGGLAL